MKVAIVIFDGVQSLDVAGPLDVFAEAGDPCPQAEIRKSPLSDLGPGQ